MYAHLSVPASSNFYMESFRLPSVGKTIHRIIRWTKNAYSDMAFMLVGVKDLLLANRIEIDDKDVKTLNRLNKLLKMVMSGIDDSTDMNLIEIRESVGLSLQTIAELLEIVEDKKKYATLKKEMFVVSTSAIVSNLKKYREPAYEN